MFLVTFFINRCLLALLNIMNLHPLYNEQMVGQGSKLHFLNNFLAGSKNFPAPVSSLFFLC